jgi:hypothetical protein
MIRDCTLCVSDTSDTSIKEDILMVSVGMGLLMRKIVNTAVITTDVLKMI